MAAHRRRTGEVATWFTTPVPRTQPPRDELAIKLALAVTVPGVDVGTLIQRQRGATMTALQDYTRLKRTAGASAQPADLAWSLVLDSLVFAAEAEIRWLDHCEARVRRAAVERAEHRGAGAHGKAHGAHRGGRARGPPPTPVRRPPDEPRTGGAAAHRRHARARGGRQPGGGAARGLVRGPRRRAGRGDGALGLGQVDAAHHRRRPRPPHRGSGRGGGHRPGRAHPGRALAVAAYLDRLRLPGLQPDPGAHRRRERRPAPRARRRARGRGAPGRPARAGGGRHRRPRGPLPRRHVRRPAAAGGDRSRDRRGAAADPRRRAHGGARQRDGRGDPAAAAGALRRRCCRRPGHPRGAARRLGRPGSLRARRRGRRRVRLRSGGDAARGSTTR